MRPSRVLGGRAVLLILSSLIVGGLTGCKYLGWDEVLPNQTLAYKKSKMAEENLELPPDLKGAAFDDAMDIPPVDGAATYSQYTGARAQRQVNQGSGSAGEILPTVEKVELRRSGDSRWLEVVAPPPQVWPKVVAFWRDQGILMVEQNPAVGVMKTDWIENRAEIPKDFITRWVSKVAAGLYSTSTRDQYIIRMEAGPTAGTTDVHLTHRGMEEKLDTGTLGDQKRSVWQPAKSDPGKEAEMLRRLMLFLGAPDKRAAAVLASTAPTGTTSKLARVVTEGAVPVLIIPEDFQRAWRITGSALDRAGFAVKDRDMSRGLYYVRYQDTDAGATPKKKGWLERLAFWRKSEIDTVKEYQIKVEGKDKETRVSVLDTGGKRDSSESAARILSLLQSAM